MSLLSPCALDRQPRALPLRIADVEAPRLQAATAKQAHSVVRVDAIGAATVGAPLATLRPPADERIKLVDRRRAGAGDMTGAKLSLGAHIEQDDIATLEPERQLLSRQLLDPAPLAEVLVGQHRHLGHMTNRDITNRRPQLRDPIA